MNFPINNILVLDESRVEQLRSRRPKFEHTWHIPYLDSSLVAMLAIIAVRKRDGDYVIHKNVITGHTGDFMAGEFTALLRKANEPLSPEAAERARREMLMAAAPPVTVVINNGKQE